MIETYKKTELEKLIRATGVHLSKKLGQNFLIDRNIVEKITDGLELSSEDTVVEIGAGAGALTVMLAQQAGHVKAIELDRNMMPLLKAATDGLSAADVLNEDFLKFDLNATAAEAGKKIKVAGNLPYYITTPIITKIFEEARDVISLGVFMMQKEVAERLLSPPGKKAYGAISVFVQYYTEPEMLFEVSREVFLPKPGVDSAVIRLRPRDLSADDPVTTAVMFRLVRAGFDMRRKTLKNSLSRAGFSAEELASAFEQVGLDPGLRAETLSARTFYDLATILTI